MANPSIIKVQVWRRSDGVSVADVFYTSGSFKRFFRSFASCWPETVHRYIDSHIPSHPNTYLITEYSEESGLRPYFAAFH